MDLAVCAEDLGVGPFGVGTLLAEADAWSGAVVPGLEEVDGTGGWEEDVLVDLAADLEGEGEEMIEELFGLCALWGRRAFGGLFERIGAVPGR